MELLTVLLLVLTMLGIGAVAKKNVPLHGADESAFRDS